MTQNQFDNLRRGDLVRHKGTGLAWVVQHYIGGYYIAVRTSPVSNLDEWEIVNLPPKKEGL